nr:HAMP domain-containing sensor histidine kinase [Desulfohalovibrio reitneri]
MLLDIATLTMALALTLLVTAGAIAYQGRLRGSVPGTRLFVAGCLSFFLGLVCISLRAVTPPWLTIVAANLLVILAEILFWNGFRVFLGRPPRHSALLVLPAALVPLAYFSLVEPWLYPRMLTMSACLTLFSGLAARELLRGNHYGRPQRLLGFMFLAGSGTYLAEGVWLLLAQPPDAAAGMGILSLVYLVSIVFAIVLLTGIILMISERLSMDLASERDRAEKANQAKSEFLANMSHEMRTPLAGVDGELQLLAGTPLSERQRKRVRTAREATEGLKAIIDDLLDLSAVEHGHMRLRERAFRPGELLRQAMDIPRRQAEAKGLAFHLDASDLPQAVRGDDHRLRQVLANLADNAVKYTPGGEVRVTGDIVAARGGERLRFTVSDTGPGITPAERRRVFEAFYRSRDASGTRGLGLGLPLCARIAELMGGELDVDDTPSGGCRFTLTTPWSGRKRRPTTGRTGAAAQTCPACGFCWPRTTTSIGAPCAGCWSATVSWWTRPLTASARWRRCGAAATTPWSWTCACRCWTAWKPPGASAPWTARWLPCPWWGSRPTPLTTTGPGRSRRAWTSICPSPCAWRSWRPRWRD